MAVVETRDGLSAPEGEAARTQAGFEINGKRYDIPRLDTITLDEERILYVYADTVLQDFMPADPNASEDERRMYEALQGRRIRNPDFKRALAHIAYRRVHPEVQDSEIQIAIGKANALEVDLAMLRGDDDDPPAQSSQKQRSESSESSDSSSRRSSGSPTENDSDRADEIPARTGTTESDTSSPGVVQIASAR